MGSFLIAEDIDTVMVMLRDIMMVVVVRDMLTVLFSIPFFSILILVLVMVSMQSMVGMVMVSLEAAMILVMVNMQSMVVSLAAV